MNHDFANKSGLSIDFLRAIGLFLVILAHINPLAILFQIRLFDVMLLVFVSWNAYCFSTNRITI